MKKAAMLALVAALSASCAAAAGKQTLKFRQVHQGGYAAYDARAPHIVVVTTADAYRKAWATLVGSGDPPAIDFSRESALILFAGMKNSGGYAVNASGVSVAARKATVTATIKTPGKGSMVTQALTSPFTVVAIPKTSIASARWIDAGSGTAVASTAQAEKK